MKKLKVKDMVEITNGKLIWGDGLQECHHFGKDTRVIQKNDTYIGIKGESFDGNLFWKQALEKGASTVIVQGIDFTNENLEKYQGKSIILVKDTLDALQKIATLKRSYYDIPVVAITGSVGKTSTKDMIASVVSQKYKTLKTIGNNNNHIGLPLTILNLEDHEVAILEMGMNHEGEIRLLTNIAKPTLAVITNIGTSHIGNLGSRENILKAKLEILEGMEDPYLMMNQDNDLLKQWGKQNHGKIKIKTYGVDNPSEIQAEDIILEEEGSQFVAVLKDKKFKVSVPVAGIHFVYNALCAILVGDALGLTIEQIQKGITSFELTKKRMDITTLNKGIKIINDAYNASFESMQASLKILGEYKNNRKIAVLGDMFELGEFAKELHQKVGQEVVINQIDFLICSGENAKYIAQSAKEQGMKEELVYYFESKEEIMDFIEKIKKPEDVILFKASNGMKFFDLVQKIQERG